MKLELLLQFILLWTITKRILSNPTITPSNPVESLNSINNVGDQEFLQKYGAQMLSYMNLSVQPCDDFYEYACGNWKNTISPKQSDKRRVNLYETAYKLNEIIETILQRPDIEDVAPELGNEFENAQKFYRQCLNTDLYPMRKSEEYLKILNKIGGFPALDSQWNSSQFNWVNMSAHLSNYGVANLVKEDQYPIYPFAPYFKLPEFGFDIELRYDTIVNITSDEYQLNRKRIYDILMVYEVPENEIDPIINGIFEFLKAILTEMGKFGESVYKCERVSRKLYTWEEFRLSHEHWDSYYEIAWGGNFELEERNYPCMYFYSKLNSIVEEHSRAVANYLSLKFLYHLDARLEDPQFHKEYCTSSLKNALIFFFDHLYMKLYFSNDIIEDVLQIAKEIKFTLQTLLNETDSMDESSREEALLKVNTIELFIGRYEDPATIQMLLGELKDLKFAEEVTYEVNKLTLEKFRVYMKRYYGLHLELFNENTKPMDILIGMQLDAFYFLLDNNIYVPAGMLQLPSYHSAWPNSLKYGTLGFILAHEFSHSVGSRGSMYDHRGLFIYWWSDETTAIFHKRSKCYVKFYNNYTVPEINRRIRGHHTKEENIADASGLHMALMSYRRFVQEEQKNYNSKLEQIPGLEQFTPEQLFFLGAAQLWCSSFKVAHYWQEIADPHTIDKYRVLGMVTNNRDFSKVYNCPVGSKMNPSANKCRIW